MPVGFCLRKEYKDTFEQGLDDGSIDLDKLSNMSSLERRGFFNKIVKDEATSKWLNSEFEGKLLLKNQQKGMITWARDITGMKPDVKRDLITKISKMDKVLDPAEKEQFLADLAEKKLGVGVTVEEANKINDLSNEITKTGEAKLSTKEEALKPSWTATEADMAHARAKVAMLDYVKELKEDANQLKLSDFKKSDINLTVPARVIRFAADASKSVGASLDNSFSLRQGQGAFWSNNKQWRQGFIQSNKNFIRSLKDAKAVEAEMDARLMADPHYESAIKDGLRLGNPEDVFSTLTPGKLPVVGRAFNASEVAYKGFANELRLGIYKKQLANMDKAGIDITKSNVDTKGMAQMVNSLTGAASLRSGETIAKNINFAFYSLRFLQSHFDQLILHPLGSGVGGTLDKMAGKDGAKNFSYAQKQAVGNIVKIIAGTAAVMELANTLAPGSVELDPHSTDFGKIKIGDTRFDISGGKAGVATLIARVAPLLVGMESYTKSGITGKINQLNTGNIIGQTGFDVVLDFFANKMSPIGGLVRDDIRGQDAVGNKFDMNKALIGLVSPLAAQNYFELQNNPKSAPTIVGVLSDFFGISTNTYGSQKNQGTSTWSTSSSKDINEFKSKVGADKFNKAAQSYDMQYSDWLDKVKGQQSYKDKSPDAQSTLIQQEKDQLKSNIFKQNNFKPTKAKKGAKDSLLNL